MMPKPRENTLLDWSSSYLSLGWSLVFFEPGTKGPHGKNAIGWNTPRELVTTHERAATRLANGPMNIGVCHQPSGTVSLDIDDEGMSRFIFDELGLDYDAILGAGMRIKSKNNRDKAIFAAPADLDLYKIQWPKQGGARAVERQTIFELRAGPNQDVLPPSLHPDGHHYEWVDGRAPWDFKELPKIPPELEAFWRNIKDFEDEIKRLCPWSKAWEKPKRPPMARRSTDGRGLDIIGKFNQANSIADLLVGYGYKRRGKRFIAPSSSTGMAGVVIFDNDKCYSHHGSDLLADGHSHDAFDLLVILEHGGDFQEALNDAAKQLGLERGAEFFDEIPLSIDLDQFIKNTKDKIIKEVRKEIKQQEIAHDYDSIEAEFSDIPDHLLTLPGVLGEIQTFSLATAHVSSKPASLMAAIALIGSVMANKFQTTTGLRSNNYMILVAGTGRGKEHPRKINKAILDAAGLMDTHIGGEEIASGQGLMTAAAARPMSLFQLDEFGMWLASAGSEKAGNWERAILSNMMKLHSGAGSVVIGQEKADQRSHARTDIRYPCISVFGTSTASELVPALKSGQVASGFLNRMIFLLTKAKIQKRNQKARPLPVPESIVEWVKAAVSYHCNLEGMSPENPVTVDLAEDAFDAMMDFEDELIEIQHRGGIYEKLYVRAWEHASKLAMIRAVSRMSVDDLRSFKEATIELQDVTWATDFVRFSFKEMAHLIELRAGDSEFEQQCKEVARVIRNSGAKGRTEDELSKFSRMFKRLNGQQRDAILGVLRRDELISMTQMRSLSGRGKVRKAWVACEFITEQEANV